MESYIKDEMHVIPEEVIEPIEPMGKKVLIATLYSPEPVILAITKLGPERIILLIDKESNKEQDASVKLIQESIGKVIDVKVVKTDVYNIVEIAKECVKIID